MDKWGQHQEKIWGTDRNKLSFNSSSDQLFSREDSALTNQGSI